MDTLYSWTARRAGAGITVQHSTGRIVGATGIFPDEYGRVHLERGTGPDVLLSTAPYSDAETDQVNTGVSDLFFNFADAGPAFNEESDAAALAVAADFQIMLRAAGIVPPTAAALVADFRGRL